MLLRKFALFAGASLLTLCPAAAGAQETDTGLEVLQLLVDEGIVPAAKAQEIFARARAAAATRQQREAPRSASTIDVPYVPQAVRDDIKAEVKAEMTADARRDGWLAPNALPGWLNDVKLSGDVRVRHQWDFFAKRNFDQFPDVNAINAAGGVPNFDFPLLNSTQNRGRFQYRARLAVDAHLSDAVQVGVRLASGDDLSPIATEATAGDFFRKDAFYIDRAFVRVTPIEELSLIGGRMANPFVHTDILWDEDVNMQGVAGTAQVALGGSFEGLNLFAAGGAFPLLERADDKPDRWLYAGQAGVGYTFNDALSVRLAGSYYDFTNVQSQRNPPASRANDNTAPPFLGKGNTFFNIRSDGLTSLAGIASRFELIDVTGDVTYRGFGDVEVKLVGDWIKNIGYDRGEINARLAGEQGVVGGNTAYQVRLEVGNPDLAKLGDWRVSAAYKRIETDAVLDIFNDNDFGLGGTDVEGYVLRGAVGIYRNTAVRASWFSTKSIERPPFDIDVLQLDLVTKF